MREETGRERQQPVEFGWIRCDDSGIEIQMGSSGKGQGMLGLGDPLTSGPIQISREWTGRSWTCPGLTRILAGNAAPATSAIREASGGGILSLNALRLGHHVLLKTEAPQGSLGQVFGAIAADLRDQ